MRMIRSMCAVFLTGVLAGQALAWQAAQVTRYDETDLPGNDIGGMAGRARSFDDCAQRCIADGRCAAFTFNLNNRNCIPKSSGDSPQRNVRAASGLVSRGGDGGGPRPGHGGGDLRGVTRYDATDFPGSDLDDLVGGARSYEDCADRCLADGRCAGFTFNLQNGNCIPKSQVGAAERNEGAVSGALNRGGGRGWSGGGGYRPGRPPPVERHDSTDFPGNDIGDLVGGARSFDDCAQRCLADGRCAAFTFNLNNRNCIPKSAAGSPQRNARAVSGVVGRR